MLSKTQTNPGNSGNMLSTDRMSKYLFLFTHPFILMIIISYPKKENYRASFETEKSFHL